MNKILIIGLLVSLVGLGFTIQQQVNVQQAIENKIEAGLKHGLSYIEDKTESYTQVLDETVHKGIHHYPLAHYETLQKKVLAIKDTTTKRLLEFNQNGQFNIIDYRSFFDNNDDYLEAKKQIKSSNLKAINDSLKGTYLQNILVRNLLINAQCHLTEYFLYQTGHTGMYFPVLELNTLSSLTTIPLNSTFQAKIFTSDINDDKNYKYNIFINGKASKSKYNFKYKMKPTQTGKQEYLIEVKNRNNETVFEHTHHFFVENCKALKQPINE